jgi:hypothetical protein
MKDEIFSLEFEALEQVFEAFAAWLCCPVFDVEQLFTRVAFAFDKILTHLFDERFIFKNIFLQIFYHQLALI